jgi:hypothetical protein
MVAIHVEWLLDPVACSALTGSGGSGGAISSGFSELHVARSAKSGKSFLFGRQFRNTFRLVSRNRRSGNRLLAAFERSGGDQQGGIFVRD